jgi:hypothetical protein
MYLALLEHADVRRTICDNFAEFEARCNADIESAKEALSAAGEDHRAALDTRAACYTLLAQLNKSFKAVAEDLRTAKTDALTLDLDHHWKAVYLLRQKRERIAERIDFVTRLKLPEAQLAVHVAEGNVELRRANLLEAQTSLARGRVIRIADMARAADAGASVSLETSASAKIMEVVKRIREQVVPEYEAKTEQMTAALTAARAEAQTTLFG